MKPTRTRLAGVAAALSAIAIAAPVSTAGAATAAPDAIAPPQAASITGPTIITTAPGVTFINTNNQVAEGDTWSGGQFAP
jgi:hypothetical protein